MTRLEGAWGAWLVGARQAGAAVPHLIEAGDTRGALAAALKAHHYKKALQIVQVQNINYNALFFYCVENGLSASSLVRDNREYERRPFHFLPTCRRILSND